MKNISEYINEARVQTGPVEIEYTPKDRDELIDAIKDVAKAQSRRKVLNFNCIDTKLVQNMDNLFWAALHKMPVQAKKDFLVDQWDVSNVNDFSAMFWHCSGFTGKGLENWKVSSKCKDTCSMFEQTAIEEIDMTRWDLSGLVRANDMFCANKNLRSVQFPKETPRLDSVIRMFQYSEALTYVKLPQKVSGCMHWTHKMFNEAGSKHNRLVVDNLDSIVLPKTDGKNVDDTTCSEMFLRCGIMPDILKAYTEGQNLSGKDMKTVFGHRNDF
jgi:hypothetical protein